MSSDTKAALLEVLKAFLVPLIASLVVGAASAYVATKVTLARFDERISALEKTVLAVEGRLETQEALGQDMRERMVRVETKIDVLIMNQRPSYP